MDQQPTPEGVVTPLVVVPYYFSAVNDVLVPVPPRLVDVFFVLFVVIG